ncbi:MAG: hypothetical protein WCG28_01245 [bacterium]
MRRQAKKIFILATGITFIILGLIGLVLPVLQGVLFLIIGFILISFYFPKVRLLIKKHVDKYPHLSPVINKIETWIIKFIGEI